jgi:hypothetical protein
MRPDTPDTLPPEHPERIIAQRRAAQLDWHTARLGVEQAARALTAAISARTPRSITRSRSRLAEAERGEREARSNYQRVARETGMQLSRLLRKNPSNRVV